MTTPPADSPERNDIELPPAVHWPTVYAMAGVGGGLLAALLAVVLIAAAQSQPAPQPAATVAEAPSPPGPAAPAARPAAPTAPAPADSEPPEWKPLVPPPAPVSAPVAMKRGVNPPDLGAVLDQAQVSTVAPITVVRGNESYFASDLQAYVREIDLDAVPRTSAKLMQNAALPPTPDELRGDPAAPKEAGGRGESVVQLIAHRSDLAGLPVRRASECRLAREAAKALAELSETVRAEQASAERLAREGQSATPTGLSVRDQALIGALAERKEWLKDAYAPGLAQMLCAEDPPVRLQLTKMLTATKGRNASVALAREALFDLSPEVRRLAVQALKDRPREEYRQTLVDGFRYPLPAVADRAAAALTAVDDRGAVPALSRLLGLPDPAAPAPDENGRWVKAEVVKVNHLRNCLLCHAPSAGPEDPVRGFVPKPGQEIPVAYYAAPDGDFVRADVTYLKQDFSQLECVPDPDKWPARQRFDYLVRRRELTDDELIDLADAGLPPSESYPQREAILSTLTKLNRPAAGQP